jgi:chromate transporter
MGCMTFVGGYAVIPVAERELIKKRGWVTMDEIMDYYAIAQITPGIIAVNLSTFIGCKQKGPLGGVLATLGFILPGISFILILGLFFINIAETPVVLHVFAGIRIAVGALVLDMSIKMIRTAVKDPWALILWLIAFSLSVVWKISPLWIITGAGVAGIILYIRKTQK